jgi:type I restriction enzyme S subunit
VPLATNQGFANFTPKPGTDSKYLAYALQYYTAEIASLAGSTTFKEVRRGALKQYKVPLPPISEQQRIVEILDQADALRKKRADALAKAARLLPAIFYKMFGDPETNPFEWHVKLMSEVTEFVTDGTHQPPPFVDNGIPFLLVQNIISGKIDFRTKKFITQDTYEELTKNREPQRNDILYSTVGSYGVAVVVETDLPFSFQRHIGHIRCIEELINPIFLCAQMNTPFIKRQADNRARGIAQKTLNLSEIKNFRLVVPPVDKQEEFAEVANKAMGTVEKSLAQSKKLKRLCDVLIHRAFSGDLTDKWREPRMKKLLAEMEEQAKYLGS